MSGGRLGPEAMLATPRQVRRGLWTALKVECLGLKVPAPRRPLWAVAAAGAWGIAGAWGSKPQRICQRPCGVAVLRYSHATNRSGSSRVPGAESPSASAIALGRHCASPQPPRLATTCGLPVKKPLPTCLGRRPTRSCRPMAYVGTAAIVGTGY